MRIFISVAEHSADLHAASLIRAASRLIPHARFEGLTGPRMRAAGADTILDVTASSAMLAGVFGVLGKGLRAIDAATLRWCTHRPDAVVLIDSGVLNLPLARRAHALGIPVVYYIAPQTWASREYRVRTLRRAVSRVACILPFEEAYFRSHGVNATYVGHPLLESLVAQHVRAPVVEALRSRGGPSFVPPHGSPPRTAQPLIAALPGSRRHVVETMLPLQFDVWQQLCARKPAPRLAISAADESRLECIQRFLSNRGYGSRVWRPGRAPATIEPTLEARRWIDVLVDDNASLLTAADLVLVASGTSTLEVAYHRKPMIVMYDAGPLFGTAHRLIGGWIVHTPHLSLVNILAGRRVVPEFMPSVQSTEAVARVASDLLDDEVWRGLMVRQLDETVRPLADSRASERICELIAAAASTSPS